MSTSAQCFVKCFDGGLVRGRDLSLDTLQTQNLIADCAQCAAGGSGGDSDLHPWQVIPDTITAVPQFSQNFLSPYPGVNVATNDLLFGSTSTEDTGNATEFNRIVFDKSGGGFFAGRATGTQFNAANRGPASANFGESNLASSNWDFVVGLSNTVSAQASSITGGSLNSIAAAAATSTIGGGLGNTISDIVSFIGGGSGNNIGERFCFIGGGTTNRINTDAPFSGIVGGSQNTIDVNSQLCFIGGGELNLISSVGGIGADHCVIAGGISNQILDGTRHAIGGGSTNVISVDVTNDNCTIAGGEGNRILLTSDRSTIGGGFTNRMNSAFSVICGGRNNINTTGSDDVIGGGFQNVIDNAQFATIGGGSTNSIIGGSQAVVGGGANNQANGANSTVGGGNTNVISGSNCVIGGGLDNAITTALGFCTIGGGTVNRISLASGATIGGGTNNAATGNDATVPGGNGNAATGAVGFCAGSSATDGGNANCFVWGGAAGAIAVTPDTFVIGSSLVQLQNYTALVATNTGGGANPQGPAGFGNLEYIEVFHNGVQGYIPFYHA